MDLMQLESIVATQLKVKVTNDIGASFPKLSFTTEITDNTPSFPNVYIHELEPSEVGNSIPNQTIHALRDTFQIEASSNSSKSDAHKVIISCVKALKSLRYGIVMFPYYDKTNNIHRYIIRARRIIANGDEF